MKEINLIISQRQFVYNQEEGRRIRKEREEKQQKLNEIKKNRRKQIKILEVSYVIVVWCLIVLAFMWIGTL